MFYYNINELFSKIFAINAVCNSLSLCKMGENKPRLGYISSQKAAAVY